MRLKILLVCLLTCTLTAPPLWDELYPLLDHGTHLYQSGKYLEAEAAYELGHRMAVAQGATRLAIRFLAGRGNCRFMTGRLHRALDDYLEALRLAEKARDREMIGARADAIAMLYYHLPDFEASREAAERGLAALGERGDPKYRAPLLRRLAKIRAQEEHLDEAVPLFKQAIEAARRSGNPSEIAMAWNGLGYAYLKNGRLQEAEDALRMNRGREIFSSYLYLGMLRMEQKDLTAAAAALDKAISVAKRLPGVTPSYYAYCQRGRLRMMQDRTQEALDDFREALKLGRVYRLQTPPADSNLISSEGGIDNFYSLIIDAAWKLYSRTRDPSLAREAFEAAEENRAASLRTLLAESAEETLPPEYSGTLALLQRAEVQALSANTPEIQAEIRRLHTNLIDMENRVGLDALQWRQAGASPGRGLSTGRRPVFTDLTKRTQSGLRSDEALVTFHVGETASYRWVVTRNSFLFDEMPAKPQIKAAVERFSNAVRNNAPEAVPLGRKLYDELFGGAARQILATKPNWLLALDDALFRLPFAALPADLRGTRPVYLAQRHATRVIPTLLLHPGIPNRMGHFLGVGDPVYNVADPRWHGTSPSVQPMQMPRLVGSRQEIEACASAWSPGRPPVLLHGINASQRRVEQELARNPSVVHFAVHAVESPKLESFLALSLSPSGAPEFLTPSVIASWRGRAHPGLVVLSSCSSAGGAVLPATGMIGLTRAWLLAGADAVAASLWDTPDSGGEFFRHFYKHLRTENPAVALEEAQRDMILSGSRLNYWAAYFVVGRN